MTDGVGTAGVVDVVSGSRTASTSSRFAEPAAATASEVLAKHGRSFRWASTFLDRQHARDAATLYAFCRHADDMIDERPAAEGTVAIAALRDRVRSLHQPVRGESPPDGRDPQAAFWQLVQRRRLDPHVIDILLETLQRDAGPVRLHGMGELLRYAYGVASTVGLMMCDVLECSDQRARAFAIDLGVAMQLTNVARDVLEDAYRDRIYVPLPAEVRPEQLRAGPGRARDLAMIAVHEVLERAARHYRSADRGLCYLPLRARAAILCASRIYEGIGAVIRRRGPDYWSGRCHVGVIGKLWHTSRAGACMAVRPRYWRRGRGAVHDRSLHAELRGLPFVEPA